MTSDEQNDKVPEVSFPNDTPIFLKNNAVALYTMLAILTRLKSEVGLEAMLEYIEHYQKLIERYNPDFRQAVNGALDLMDVVKMYRDITENENV
jgi:hypothetical protein